MKGIQCDLCGKFRSKASGYITVTISYEDGEVTHYCGRTCLANGIVHFADTARLKAHLAELGEIDGRALAEAIVPFVPNGIQRFTE